MDVVGVEERVDVEEERGEGGCGGGARRVDMEEKQGERERGCGGGARREETSRRVR